jgi:hypothetical protein
MTGIHKIETTTSTTTKSLPTIMSSQSFDLGRILRQISIVKMALLELKIDVNEDMSAAIITANMMPLAPVGIKSMTSFG